MARPSKLTDEVEARILEAVRQGAPLASAAAWGGIGESTFHRWCERGRKASSGRYRLFVDRLAEANAKAEVHLTMELRRLGKKEWRAIAFILERRFAHNWAERKHLDHQLTGPAGTPTALVVQLAGLDRDGLAALSGVNLDALDELSLPVDDPRPDLGPGCTDCGAGLGKPHRPNCPTQEPRP